jgi:hypothetical protein
VLAEFADVKMSNVNIFSVTFVGKWKEWVLSCMRRWERLLIKVASRNISSTPSFRPHFIGEDGTKSFLHSLAVQVQYRLQCDMVADRVKYRAVVVRMGSAVFCVEGTRARSRFLIVLNVSTQAAIFGTFHRWSSGPSDERCGQCTVVVRCGDFCLQGPVEMVVRTSGKNSRVVGRAKEENASCMVKPFEGEHG